MQRDPWSNFVAGRRRFLTASCLLGALLLTAAAPAPAQDAAKQDAAKTVKLTIDYGDGVAKSFVALPWKDKLTVFDALQAAARHPRGIQVRHRGSGETTFVTGIDDLTNAGPGEGNWRYEINGQRAAVSSGVAALQAGDEIVWRFGK